MTPGLFPTRVGILFSSIRVGGLQAAGKTPGRLNQCLSRKSANTPEELRR